MKDGKSVFVVFAILTFVLFTMHNFLGRVSAVFWVPLDKILFISHQIPPTLMWMFLGLFVGVIYGSFVAIKKFKLDFKLLIYPAAFLMGALLLVTLVSNIVGEKGIPATVTDNPEIEKLIAFNEDIQNGIRAVENEEADSAAYYFQKAVELDANNPKLDSLAQVYSQIGKRKCKLYRRRSKLKYISNNYYNYAAVLTRKTPEICK